MVKIGGGAKFELIRTFNLVVVQTKPKAPEPIRTPKLSGFRHSQY